MRNIAGLNMLLRARFKLPAGLRLATDEFREGWNFVTGDASKLEKKIRSRGWNFIRIADGAVRGGIGETSQEAIRNALVHALRCISEPLNAVQVAHITSTQYPWFFLARVTLFPYRIQQDAVLAMPDRAPSSPAVRPRSRVALGAPDLSPHFQIAIHELKEVLVLSRSTDGMTQ